MIYFPSFPLPLLLLLLLLLLGLLLSSRTVSATTALLPIPPITRPSPLPSSSSSSSLQPLLHASKAVMERLPLAIFTTLNVSLTTFLGTTACMTPFTILFNAGSLRQEGIRAVGMKGLYKAAEWGQISAVFSGAEQFMKVARKKDDRWNAYIGSGLGTASLNLKEGPIGMAKGFIGGVAFLYIFDNLLMMKDISAPMSSSSSSVSSGRKIKLKKPSMKSAGGPRKPPFKK